MSNTHSLLKKELSQLKDFQNRTADYVFSRFFGKHLTNRFLLADEVGLGKTLVARGIIAKTLNLLKRKERIDIIYICSNATIARQNVSRLNVTGNSDISISTRLTYLPKDVHRLTSNKINFIRVTNFCKC